jgi:hypothetical protein
VIHLLRVVEERERPDRVVAQTLVVEEDARGDERPGQAAAAGLVRARDEADAETAVEGEQLAARPADGRHGARIPRRRDALRNLHGSFAGSCGSRSEGAAER